MLALSSIFVIDRSGSMGYTDRRPLAGTPVTARISQYCNNRLGAVYSALYAFWKSRQTAMTTQQSNAARRDAYSVILFDHAIYRGVINDFTSTPEALLDSVIRYSAGGGTNYDSALSETRTVIQQNWSTER